MKIAPLFLFSVNLVLTLPFAGLLASGCDTGPGTDDAGSATDSAHPDRRGSDALPTDTAMPDARNTDAETADGTIIDSTVMDSAGLDAAFSDQASPMPDAAAQDHEFADTNPVDTRLNDSAVDDAAQAIDSGAPVLTYPVFFDAPLPSSVREQSADLSCNVPGIQAIQSRKQASLQGTDVSSVVGVDDRFAGIGAKFELHNNAHADGWVNVLEPRSGAGAGWQTSFLIQDANAGIIVFNQAAGNAIGYQWGYATTMLEDGNNIYATTWNPLDSDHIHMTTDNHSPCVPSGYSFDDGAVDISGSLVQTDHGVAMAWRNRFRYKSTTNQSWISWSAEQAFYLDRATARAGNLRLYLVAGATHHGPFAIYDDFSIPNASCTDSFCNTGAYDYAVLVWNIFGLDIGVALPDLSHGSSINLEKHTYCADTSNDSCGNINFHSWLIHDGLVSYTNGQIREFSQVYYVGTLPQLSDLGYTIW